MTIKRDVLKPNRWGNALRTGAAKDYAYVGSKYARPPKDSNDERSVFQHDKDEIIYSKAFRRMAHKTQVLLAPESDHYRSRLTHTLEVTAIAEHIAKGLFLNADLTVAIALGHDLGHVPFGHAGERALGDVLKDRGGHPTLSFQHNIHSAEIVKNDLKGISSETIDGIKNHRWDYKNPNKNRPKTLEGQVVAFADEIAAINHDIEDGLDAKLIKPQDIPFLKHKVVADTPHVSKIGDLEHKYLEVLKIEGVEYGRRHRVAAMTRSIIAYNREQWNKKTPRSAEMDPSMVIILKTLKTFIQERVISDIKVKTRDEEAHHIIKKVFEYYHDYFLKLGKTKQIEEDARFYAFWGELKQKKKNNQDAKILGEFISGMTDRYILQIYRRKIYPIFS